MGIVYLLIVAFLFSFGGTCAKLVGAYISSEYISFLRFFFGVIFLLLLKLVTRHHFRSDFKSQLRANFKWLLLGGAAKEFSYLCENYALTHGLSYGNILTQPAQLLFITFCSVVFFREKLSRRRAFFILPCVAGVLLVSWNGRALSDYLSGGVLFLVLYVLAGISAGTHILMQKKVADKMDILDSNLTMFSLAAVLAVIPLIGPTMGGALAGIRPDVPAVLAMIFFGFITGIGFYFNAKAIPLVPLYIVPVIQCTMVLFAISWGVIFFHEPLTVYLVGGSALFIVGIIGIQTA